MYAYKIIFLFFISFYAYAGFYKETQARFSSASSISLNENYKNNDVIKSPSGTYQIVLELIIIDSERGQEKDCVVYKVPEKDKMGGLKIISIKKDEPCSQHIFDQAYVSWKSGIRNFGFNYNERKLALYIDTHDLEYQLFNVKLLKKYKIYDAPKTNTLTPGVFLSFISNEKNSKKEKLENGDLCFDLSDDCIVIRSDLCHLCPGKIIEVKASKCNYGYRKYCDDQVCGEKNAPACIRGSDLKFNKDYCSADSPFAFCKNSLKLFCNSKNELRCH